ncbi:MAG: hypothetical protein CMH54_01735 [Myxococcales bacterium]|nr:hypothetical protein [Myxococcales bacterium]
MIHRLLIVGIAVVALSCANGEPGANGQNPASPKSDQTQGADVEWANGFFLTQIYDARWNDSGMESDESSNNCGPASLAMVMRERGVTTDNLNAQIAIDHARALMFPDYPNIDPSALQEGATMYEEGGVLCVEDKTRTVYFDHMDDAPSIPQGIINGGGTPVFGYSWDDLETFLQVHGSAIAYGHITDDWSAQFSTDYGSSSPGAVPHFIAIFPASTVEDFIVCDPMHRGGAVIMSRNALRTFFKSPVNVYETTIRLIAWHDDFETGE